MKMRRWIWLYMWVLSLAVISCYGGAVSYGIFWGITLIPVISLIYLVTVYFHIRIFQQIESRHMVCGQAVPYVFVVKNESRCLFAGISVGMYSSFSEVEELPEHMEYELLPKDKWTFETKLLCRYRGEYEVGVKEIIMTDFFRMFQIRHRIPDGIKAQVLPRITRVSCLRSVDELTAHMQKESLSDRVEPDVVVRDYVAGDAQKQIHWKATAREQKLKVRSRIGEEKSGISIVWDPRRYGIRQEEYLPIEDKILETVLALGIFLAEKNISFTAFYGQNGIMSRHVRGIGDYDGFYQCVADVSFNREESLDDGLAQLAERGAFTENKIVFCVMHHPDDEIFKTAQELNRAGIMTVFYVVTDENMEQYGKWNTERCKIIAISAEAELEGII